MPKCVWAFCKGVEHNPFCCCFVFVFFPLERDCALLCLPSAACPQAHTKRQEQTKTKKEPNQVVVINIRSFSSVCVPVLLPLGPSLSAFPSCPLFACSPSKTKKNPLWNKRNSRILEATERLALTLIFRLHVAVVSFFLLSAVTPRTLRNLCLKLISPRSLCLSFFPPSLSPSPSPPSLKSRTWQPPSFFFFSMAPLSTQSFLCAFHAPWPVQSICHKAFIFSWIWFLFVFRFQKTKIAKHRRKEKPVSNRRDIREREKQTKRKAKKTKPARRKRKERDGKAPLERERERARGREEKRREGNTHKERGKRKREKESKARWRGQRTRKKNCHARCRD